VVAINCDFARVRRLRVIAVAAGSRSELRGLIAIFLRSMRFGIDDGANTRWERGYGRRTAMSEDNTAAIERVIADTINEQGVAIPMPSPPESSPLWRRRGIASFRQRRP
jgi:hypothetical protein